MKNKWKLVVSLAIILTLALLAFTGCVTEVTEYDIDSIGIVTISDAVESSLQSCVVVQVRNSTIQYYAVGIAITEDRILVPRQTIPTLLTQTYDFSGKTLSDSTNHWNVLEYHLSDNLFEEDYGFNILRLKNTSIKLTPVKFGNSDDLKLGEMTFGFEFSKPDSDAHSSSTYLNSLPLNDYVRVLSVMVSSKSMMYGAHNPTTIPEIMQKETFTTQGYFNKSDVSSFVTNGYKHGFSDISSSYYYTLTNCMLFNKAGEFVGMNYMRRVDNNNNNENVVIGIGYACRSNAIKSSLQNIGFEVM